MNRKTAEISTRKLVRLGKTSLAVTLPKEFVVELKWKEKQKVVAVKHRAGILIKDWKE